jgi:hypothetical protein
VNREAELTAPTGVGSGDLLGIKVIKLDKINSSVNPAAPHLLAARNRRELFFKARNFRLPAQTKNSQTYRRIAVSFQTTKIQLSNPPPKNRRVLDA